MLKSYGQILQKDVLTVVCEPEKGHELAVNSLAVFGGVNGGYITISIGDFSMEHSIAANGRIVFPFFMGVPENMAIKAIATNDDIRVCASAEQFVVDSASDNPVNPDEPDPDDPVEPDNPDEPEPDEPEEPDYASMPLTIEALEDNTQVSFKVIKYANDTTLNIQDKWKIRYKKNNSVDWVYYKNDEVITLSKVGDTVCFENEKSYLELNRYSICFSATKKINAWGNIRSLINYSVLIDDECFNGLFKTAPIVSAENLILDSKILTSKCYFEMFMNCQELIAAPKINVLSMEYYSCGSMFKGCSKLTKMPELSALNLCTDCFNSMFSGCSSLTTVNDLTSTPLFNGCYSQMFENCTSLTKAPRICGDSRDYKYRALNKMFEGCINLKEVEVDFTLNWLYDNNFYSGGFSFDWLNNVSSTGIFRKPRHLQTVFGNNFIPEGWRVVCNEEGYEDEITKDDFTKPLTFTNSGTSDTGYWWIQLFKKLELTNTLVDLTSIYYRTKTQTSWTNYTFDANSMGLLITLPNKGDYIQFQGTGTNCYGLGVQMAFRAECSGNMQSLINYSNTVPDKCFYGFFSAQKILTAPDLLGQEVGNSSYEEMFNSCNLLTKVPRILATRFGNNTCLGMFQESGVVDASNLCIKFLDNSSFKNCFWGCRQLEIPPLILAEVAFEDCFYSMFRECYKLKKAPKLDIETLVSGCFQYMFHGCNSLEYVDVNIRKWQYDDFLDGVNEPTYQWLDGVASTGEFHCNGNLTDERGENRIPEGWIKFDKSFNPPDNGIKPLTLTAIENPSGVSSVKIEFKHNFETSKGVYYKLSTETHWNELSGNTEITLENVGDYVQIWSKNNNNYITLRCDSIEVSGNLTSLLNFNNKLQESCFELLFGSQGSWSSNLIVKNEIFTNQELAPSCYANMFDSVSFNPNQTNIVLPAKILPSSCYQNMFSRSTLYSSQASPFGVEILGEKLGTYCLHYMFSLASTIKQVTVHFTEWGIGGFTDETTDGWFYNNKVTNGTFIKPSALPETRGTSYIPTNWTILNN